MPSEEPAARQPHAVLDLPSRRWKGLKIARLLGIEEPIRSLRLLEIGAGSGGISNWFGTHPSGRFEVDAVDVVDSRLVREGYRYQQVEGTRLPFDDHAFDIVLSNHVIEHVGDPAAQLEHLGEIRRVLKPGGIGYLAVPNRWMLVEPHFRLAFLSWWPESFRSTYLRWCGKGEHYDCRPLSLPAARALFRASGFGAQQHCADALRQTFEIEKPSAPIYRHVFKRLPDRAINLLAPIFPTLIFTLEPSRGG